MKKFLQALGLAVLIIIGSCATCVGVAWHFTNGASLGADGFLALLGTAHSHEAYQGATAAFRARETEAAFTARMKSLGLEQFQKSSWLSRNVENDHGEVSGQATLRDGRAVPLQMKLERDHGLWRVDAIDSPKGDSL